MKTTERTEGTSSKLFISNDGTHIKLTNYWSTESAIEGYCFMSGNAGNWRLLIPENLKEAIGEFKSVKLASIERSISIPGHFDVIAEDGTSNPYCISIDRRMFDRKIINKRCRLLVYSNYGLINNIPFRVRL